MSTLFVIVAKTPVIITQNGEPKVVVQDVESDRKLLLLLKLISQGVLDAEVGHMVEHDSLFDRLEKKLLIEFIRVRCRF